MAKNNAIPSRVKLGGRYYILDFNFQAMCILEEERGLDVFSAEFWGELFPQNEDGKPIMKPRNLRLLLWAIIRATQEEGEEPITETEVGRMLNPSNMKEVFTALTKAIKSAQGSVKEGKEEQAKSGPEDEGNE